MPCGDKPGCFSDPQDRFEYTSTLIRCRSNAQQEFPGSSKSLPSLMILTVLATIQVPRCLPGLRCTPSTRLANPLLGVSVQSL